MSEFDDFIIHIEEMIFAETTLYVTEVTGEDCCGGVGQALHEKITRKVIEALAEKIRSWSDNIINININLKNKNMLDKEQIKKDIKQLLNFHEIDEFSNEDYKDLVKNLVNYIKDDLKLSKQMVNYWIN
jgi:hypothetical protein